MGTEVINRGKQWINTEVETTYSPNREDYNNPGNVVGMNECFLKIMEWLPRERNVDVEHNHKAKPNWMALVEDMTNWRKILCR